MGGWIPLEMTIVLSCAPMWIATTKSLLMPKEDQTHTPATRTKASTIACTHLFCILQDYNKRTWSWPGYAIRSYPKITQHMVPKGKCNLHHTSHQIRMFHCSLRIYVISII